MYLLALLLFITISTVLVGCGLTGEAGGRGVATPTAVKAIRSTPGVTRPPRDVSTPVPTSLRPIATPSIKPPLSPYPGTQCQWVKGKGTEGVTIYSIHTTSTGTLLAGGEGAHGVYRSTNGGNSWEYVPFYSGLKIDDARTFDLASDASGRIYGASGNTGSEAMKIPNEPMAIPPDPFEPTKEKTAAEPPKEKEETISKYGIFFSDDDGKSWSVTLKGAWRSVATTGGRRLRRNWAKLACEGLDELPLVGRVECRTSFMI